MSATTQIDPAEIAARLGNDDFYLLDVRREDDYDAWHIDGSHNLPIYDHLLDEDTRPLERHIEEFPRNKEIVVVCVAGITSALAAEVLREHGFTARSVTNGMRGWGTLYRPFSIETLPGVTQILRPGTGCISYIIADDGEAIVIDPGMHTGVYWDLTDRRNLEIIGVVDTHAHADHISGGRALAAKHDTHYYIPAEDAGDIDSYSPLADNDTLGVGDLAIEVLSTPGHTRGSISLRYSSAVLSGDTLFVESVGRPDLGGREELAREGARMLFDSLVRLADLPADTLLLPGHFSDEPMRPVVAPLRDVGATNDLFRSADRGQFIRTLLEDLPETPANYETIKRINTGRTEPAEDAADLELGPNNCASQ